MPNNKKKLFFIILISVFAFSLDRLTKFLFVENVLPEIKVWENILSFQLHINKGVAFGFTMDSIFYYILVCLIFIILVYLLVDSYKRGNQFLLVCLFFVLIGASSNLIDRWRWQGVVDFINVEFWSVFNLADCYIVLAVIFWLVYLFKHDRKKISKAS